MEPYRPLRLIFFIYDFIRLMVMTSLLLTFLPPVVNGEDGSAGGLFPHVFYAVPNGLFTLMSFFLWLRLDAYKPYIPLYMAGKILGVVAFFTWFFVTAVHMDASLFNSGGTYTIMGALFYLSAGDALTVLGGALLKKRIRRVEADLRFHAIPKEDAGCV